MIENELEIDYHIYKTYEIMGLVGKGTYGQVYKAKHKKSQEIFAIKKICDAFQNVTDAKRTYRQLHYLFQLSHPCIVKLYQVIPFNNHKTFGVTGQSSTSRTQFFPRSTQNRYGYCTQKQSQVQKKSAKHVYAVFQYIETDLCKALRLCSLQVIQRKYISYQIFHGILYLHRSKLIHRDIKPSNILIDSNCDIKICDFGLTRLKYQHRQEQQTNIITQYVASRWYRPPEILLGFNYCDYSIDIWGIGCLMAELILRQPLFQGNTTMDQLQKIFRLIGLPKEDQITKLQTQHAKFILRNFTFSRKNKPEKINQVFGQASDEQIDLIQKLLKFNPLDRLTAEQALNHPYFAQMKQMNYNFESYNVPVKIIDHTEPSTFLSNLKTFGQQDKLKKSVQKHKRKQISLQQYQNLIQQLQRATSRSSNRIYNEKYKQNDKIIQKPISRPQASQHGVKQKSTRQSNFMYDQKQINSVHQYKLKQIQQEKQLKDIIPTKITDYLKGNRNAYSTVDYYQHKQHNFIYQHNQHNFKPNQQICVKQRKNTNIGHFASQITNQNMENNLQKQYSQSFNPFQKQPNKIKQNKGLNKNSTQKLGSNKVKKISKQGSGIQNKSKTKISSDAKKQKQKPSINMKSKPDQIKNKNASYGSLNQTNKTKQKAKRSKDQSLKQLKQASKSKHSSGSGHINKIQNKNKDKSRENQKYDSSLNRNKQKKKIKQTSKLQPEQYKQEQHKKEVLINQNYQNCFSTIQIDNIQTKNTYHQFQINKQRAIFNQSLPYGLNDLNKKSTNELKKLTNQKKSRQALLKGANSKSIGKKKSQTKISNTITK